MGGQVVSIKSAGLAAKIGALYRKGAEALIEAGEMLAAQKTSMKHGEWLTWLEQNEEALGFGERTARFLMAAASRFALEAVNRKFTSDLDIWGSKVRGTQGTGENEWHTPEEFVDLARKVLGQIDLDPATHLQAQKYIRAKKFFTVKDDGLKQKWHGRVWLNPPYAQPLIAEFVQKMIDEYASGRVTAGVMLTHNYTDTEWFQEAAKVAKAICFTRRRVKFVNLDEELAAPTQGQAFFYFGKDTNDFVAGFSGYGFVVRPVV